MKPGFEWDEKKAKSNFKRHHGVSFDEATSVFDDPRLITFPDLPHSESEARYLSIGVSIKGRILIVSHTDRNNQIRIISCRKATDLERRRYEED
jgi:uncharacterized DUF497 family protein